MLGMKTDFVLILSSDECRIFLKKRSHSTIPTIPTFQLSNTLKYLIMAEPIISDLAQRTRFSMLE